LVYFGREYDYHAELVKREQYCKNRSVCVTSTHEQSPLSMRFTAQTRWQQLNTDVLWAYVIYTNTDSLNTTPTESYSIYPSNKW